MAAHLPQKNLFQASRAVDLRWTRTLQVLPFSTAGVGRECTASVNVPADPQAQVRPAAAGSAAAAATRSLPPAACGPSPVRPSYPL